MNLAEVQALGVGDVVHIFYAKDDDPENVRSDCKHRIVEVDENVIYTEGLGLVGRGFGWEWDRARFDLTMIGIDTCRGYAYFTRIEP